MPDTKQIHPLVRAASIVPKSFDEKDNTIEVVATTTAPVLKYDYDWGTYNEVLSMNPKHVRMERINSRANVLDNHDSYSSVLDSVLGVVEKAWLDGEKLMARIRLSAREELKSFVEDVKAGIISNISIGYRIYKAVLTEEKGQMNVVEATDWEPYEVSFVSVPADYAAGTRSQKDTPTNEIQLIKNSKRNTMAEVEKAPETTETETGGKTTTATPDTNPNPAPVTTPPAEAPVVNDAGTRAATKAATQRSVDILNACRALGFDANYAQTLIANESLTTDQARAAMIEKKAGDTTQQTPTTAINTGMNVKKDETDKRRAAMTDALVLRTGKAAAIKEISAERKAAASEFRGMSLVEYAKDCAERAGETVKGVDKMVLVGRAITSSTSDFPILLGGVVHQTLLAAYNTVPDTWRGFSTTGTMSDFRPYWRLRKGAFARLDKVKENAEYKNIPIPDGAGEKAQLETYGNIVNVSRQMIINDDLGVFTSMAEDLGRAAKRSIELDVYAMLAANGGLGPVMNDGKTMIHADHGNLISSGAVPSVATFSGIKQAMAAQKDFSGNDYLDLRPSILLINIAQEDAAKVINNNTWDPSVTNKFQIINPSAGTFSKIIGTPRLPGNGYLAFADPNEYPVVEVDFLDGNETPYMETREGFTVDGMEWKIRLDYGVNAVGYKGVVKNPGA